MASSYNEVYTLPEDIVSEPKIFRFLTIRTVIILAIFLFFGMYLKEFVYEALQLPFTIFNGVVGLLFSLKSRSNPQKRLYQSVLILLARDRRFYKPIENPHKTPQTVKQYERSEGAIHYVEPEN